MRILFDTHLLLWLSAFSSRLPLSVRSLIDDRENQLYFSVVSVWEVAIKRTLGRDETMIDPAILRSELLRREYRELAIQSSHALATASLPLLHGDPFDRLLVAQASVEEMIFLTSDSQLPKYPGAIRRV